jgi:hypothetical protein
VADVSVEREERRTAAMAVVVVVVNRIMGSYGKWEDVDVVMSKMRVSGLIRCLISPPSSSSSSSMMAMTWMANGVKARPPACAVPLGFAYRVSRDRCRHASL